MEIILIFVLLDVRGPYIPRGRKMCSNINNNSILPFLPSDCQLSTSLLIQACKLALHMQSAGMGQLGFV